MRRAPPGLPLPILLAGSLLAAGCTETTLPAAEPKVTPPAATAAATAVASGPSANSPPAGQTPVEGPSVSAPSVPLPPPLEGPLPWLTRSIVAQPLPGAHARFTSIAGTGPDDLWLVSSEYVKPRWFEEQGVVYHYDGKKVKSLGHPCSPANIGGLVAGSGEIFARGFLAWSRGTWPNYHASLARGKTKWDCDGATFERGFAFAGGGRVWELGCSRACRLTSAGGREVPLPVIDPASGDGPDGSTPVAQAIQMVSDTDGWLAQEGGDGRASLLRWNGVTWTPKATLDKGLTVIDLWADEASHVWLAVGDDGDTSPANMLFRFDGEALSALAVPADLKVRKILGTGARDVWFLGEGKTVYQWDGERLRQGAAPFEIGEGWAAKGGEVFFVGTEASAPEGQIARSAAAPERK